MRTPPPDPAGVKLEATSFGELYAPSAVPASASDTAGTRPEASTTRIDLLTGFAFWSRSGGL
jgi:hypothetical protein